MAVGPLGPTLYSLARTVMVGSEEVEPSGRSMVAAVFGAKSSVARRVPRSSVTSEPRAT